MVPSSHASDLDLHLANQVTATLWLPDGIDERERERRISAALKMLQGIRPQNVLEGMLGVQMVATHEVAMECLRRSMAAPQGSERPDSTAQAIKLMGIFTKQIEALNRLRGKGGQKVTVEHVNVEAGGRAVVGNVDAGPKSNSRQRDTE